MDALPQELKKLILSSTSAEDIPNIRLVSNSLSQAAREPLFSHLHISAKGLEAEPSQLVHIKNIIASPELSQEVKSIAYTTSLEPNKTFEQYENAGWDYIPPETPKILEEGGPLKTALQLSNHFPNLNKIRIEFACTCSSQVLEESGDMPAEESLEFRTVVLSSLFKSLNNHLNTNSKTNINPIKSLTIKNLQASNIWSEERFPLSDLTRTLKELTTLHLKITTPEKYPLFVKRLDEPEQHEFFAQFPSLWLKPTSETLTNLTIHVDRRDTYWGYCPKSDFRGLHFPKLKSLEFGRYSFTHSWQLEWILSHGDTLEELVLDDCAITRFIVNLGRIDEEGYALGVREDISGHHFVRNTQTWSEFFVAFRERLPRLRVFRFGVGDWEDGRNFDNFGVDGEGFKRGVFEDMYMGFNSGRSPTWMHMNEYSMTGIRDIEDDLAEYENLMETVARRV